MQVPPEPDGAAEHVPGLDGRDAAAGADDPTGQLDAVPPRDDEDGPVASGGPRHARRHARLNGWTARRLALAGAAALVVLCGLGVGGYALASGRKTPSHRPTASSSPGTSTTAPPARPVRAPRPAGPLCPLTGLPAPGGKVPQRPVLAVKVGNNPSARPQSGLENADIVFDTLAEGGITRYIAVYQCGTSSSIGPVRSVRWDDWHILQMFGRADLAFVHGITPDVDTVQSLPWVCDLDDFAHSNLYQQDPARVPPDATYTSTAALWGACPSGPAPPAIFRFAKVAPAGAGPVASVDIPYSVAADVVWQWSAAKHTFLHFFKEGGLVADLDEHGNPLRATNVVIEVVSLQYGAYAESPGGTGDVESLTEGSGPAYVLRNGHLEKGTWSRTTWTDITALTGANGKPMTLAPGNTWVEIVPTSDPLTFVP